MSSRVVAVTILTLAIASSAFPGEKAERAPAATATPVAQAAAVDLTSLFETPSLVKVMPNGMVVATPPTHLVMLGRIGKDGKPVLRCVGSAEEAQTFLRKAEVVSPRHGEEK